MKTKLTMMVAMAAACAATQLTAMPTKEEMKRAEPVVKERLASERAALESGKKTRSEVAAAAMRLASETDSDAAKLLLMKGAFALYVKDGNLEKAVETMRALEAAISDMPPQSVTNMIEMALLGVVKKEDRARLYKLLDEPKADIPSSIDLPSHIESKAIAASVKERSSVASILKGMIKLPGRDCWLSATEVTQGQWESVMGYNNSEHKGVNLPVECVSRDDCDAFLKMLNKTKEVQASQFEFRLPDEEEWRFAAGADSPGNNFLIKPGVAGSWRRLDMAWLQDNSSNQTHVVATKAPNAFGFYDMLGNVWEWTTGCDKAGREYVRGGFFGIHSEIGTWRRWFVGRSYRSGAIGLRLAAYNRSKTSSDGCGKAGSSESGAAQRQATVDGYTWSYRVRNGEAMIVTANGRCAVSPSPRGAVSIPSTLGGVKVTSIGNNAFRNCRGLTSVTIPSCVASIGSAAFGDCAELRNVTIPESVRNIGEWAFSGCFALKSVTIPPNVERIGGGAFNNCRGLTSVTIPAKVATIGVYAFRYCSALRQIKVDAANQSFTSIGGVLYTKDRSVLLACPNALTSVEMPKSVTNIGWCACEGCSGLKSVTIPEGVDSIESGAFKECGGLVSVTIPSSVKIIGAEAFLNCKGLKSATLPEGLSDIWESAFWGCDELASLTLPKGLVKIGPNAFRGLGKLTSVTIPESVTSIGGAVFSYCGGLTQINVESENQKYTSVDGVLYTKDLTELVMCPNGLKAVTIPESVSSIGLGAFIGCSGLTSLILPSSVKSIGEWAFASCNGLASVTIPESVTKIDQYAFLNCGGLTSVTMRGERPDAPNNIFNGCGKLKAIHVPANAKSWAEMKDWQRIPLVKPGLLSRNPNRSGGLARLRKQREEAERKGEAAREESTTEKTRKDIDRLFPGWSLDSEVPQESNKDHCSGFCANHRDQNNVLRLHPVNRETPVVLSRTVTLSDKNPCLFLKVSSFDGKSDFVLSVRVNGKDVMPDRIVCTSDLEPWEDLVVPLFDWRGDSVEIEIVTRANGWWCEWSHFARIEIAEGSGQETCGLAGVKNGTETVNGYTWSYFVKNGEATVTAAVSPSPKGAITIPATLGGVKVTGLGKNLFDHCKEVTSVTVPEGVTSIGQGAFNFCYGLKSVTIPSSVKTIGEWAFSACFRLQTVTMPESLEYIGTGGFINCRSLKMVNIPAKLAEIGGAAFAYCTGLQQFNVDGRNVTFAAKDGILYSKDMSTLVSVPNVPTIAKIPSSVTKIGGSAFQGRDRLETLTIPESVTIIDRGAFHDCGRLGSATIPASVKKIEGGAFCNCGKLTEVTMLGERPEAQKDIFKQCGNLKAIHVPAKAKSWEGMKDWLGIPLVFDAK